MIDECSVKDWKLVIRAVTPNINELLIYKSGFNNWPEKLLETFQPFVTFFIQWFHVSVEACLIIDKEWHF